MFITINGLNIHYEVHGEGPAIVLLHGWGTGLRLFDGVTEYLKENHRVYSLDFPGFGLTEEPVTAWSVYDYADMTEAFLDALNISKPILMGHSFGGRISIILGAKRELSKIVLIDSAGVKPTRSTNYYAKVYFYKSLRLVEKFPGMRLLFGDLFDAYRTKAGSSDYKSATPMMRQILSKVVNDDLQHHMPKIKVPTLLIWGSEDTATPLDDGKLMEKKIKDSALITFEGAGHYSYLERAHDFKAIVQSFVTEGE